MPHDPAINCFISYNTLDHRAAEAIADGLGERGLSVFLDRRSLVAGRPWPQALEAQIARCRSVVVLLGPTGLGPWQQREQDLALTRQLREQSANAGFGVIPVLLPGVDQRPLGFLLLNTWVDFPDSIDENGLELLAAAVRGEPPAALLEQTRQQQADTCPYRGIEVFREEDAAFFFGREAFNDALQQALESQTLVAVVGRSGSGKSSVVRAGLLPLSYPFSSFFVPGRL